MMGGLLWCCFRWRRWCWTFPLLRSFNAQGFGLSFVLSAAVVPSFSLGQGVNCPAPKSVDTPADQAFVAADIAGAEKLYSTQLDGASNTTNYVGLVRAQLEQNKLPEAREAMLTDQFIAPEEKDWSPVMWQGRCSAAYTDQQEGAVSVWTGYGDDQVGSFFGGYS
jgi:hypothetical protein